MAPQQIVAFRPSDGIRATADDSLTLILLIDTLDVPADLVAFEQQQTADFLRRNAGHLARVVAIYSLEDSGFFLTAKASTDGEALARDVASDNKIDAFAVVGGSFNVPALTGLRALGTIAKAEDSQPGRKLLLWIGPGLSERGTGAYITNGEVLVSYVPSGTQSPEIERNLFNKIRWFSTLLRQARDCRPLFCG